MKWEKKGIKYNENKNENNKKIILAMKSKMIKLFTMERWIDLNG